MAMNRLTDSIKEQIAAFQRGFYEIIPRESIAIFNEQVMVIALWRKLVLIFLFIGT